MQKKVTPISYAVTLETRLFWGLAIIVAVSAIAYMVLIQATIMSVVARGEREEEIRSLRSDLLTMESQYFAKSGEFDISLAANYGLVRFPEDKTEYIARTPGTNLTFGSHAR